MPNDDATKTPDRGHQLFYEIIQSASDPNRQWMLIGKDPFGTEYCRVGFKRYGDAWQAAERRKSDAGECQADLQAWAAQRQEFRPSEYNGDILTWSERQSSLLQRLTAGEEVIDEIDWENVIEEVRSAGRRRLAELKSLLVQELAAVLKAWAWPQSSEVPRWKAQALGFQSEAAEIITPNMRRRIDINEFYFKAIRSLPQSIDGEEPPMFPTECPMTIEDLLGEFAVEPREVAVVIADTPKSGILRGK
jgi:hypothetical protein